MVCFNFELASQDITRELFTPPSYSQSFFFNLCVASSVSEREQDA